MYRYEIFSVDHSSGKDFYVLGNYEPQKKKKGKKNTELFLYTLIIVF